ncbi:hypothetical protein [Neobacillus niacini]|uniref:hypothetical protein n=1 Tax=Neobacillus niacini TaxID=86668 RepID=UPI0020420F97|nr:hypothetical protein [Neobacillus niacini]MCM3692181.1 hypothetical protein [Neobacillus niacini]
MRNKFYKLNAEFTRLILKNDMTVIENRPKHVDGTPMTKSEIKEKNNYASGIWSDSNVNKAREMASAFSRFIIKKDKEKTESGFFEKTKGAKPVERIGHINQHHLKEFVEHKKATVAASSAREYVTKLQKVFESTVEGGIKSHVALMRQCRGGSKIVDSIPNRSKETAVRSVGKTDGKKGYSLKQARELYEAVDDPMVKLAISTYTYVGQRIGTVEHMTWSDVVDEEGKIKDEMTFMHDGQMKAGRKQKAEVNAAKSELEKIYKEGEFSPDDMIFGNVSHDKIEKIIKNACEETGIDWKGIHAFRSATYEYYDTEKIPEMTKNMSMNDKKEWIATEIMKLADIEVQDKNGNWHKPHNKPIKKTEPQYELKRNADGSLALDTLGRTITVRKMKEVKNKKTGKIRKVPDDKKFFDEKGQPVMVPKYQFEKLKKAQWRTLKELYVAQQLSHNRRDANKPYKNHKEGKED